MSIFIYCLLFIMTTLHQPVQNVPYNLDYLSKYLPNTTEINEKLTNGVKSYLEQIVKKYKEDMNEKDKTSIENLYKSVGQILRSYQNVISSKNHTGLTNRSQVDSHYQLPKYEWINILRADDGSLYIPAKNTQSLLSHLLTLAGFAKELVTNEVKNQSKPLVQISPAIVTQNQTENLTNLSNSLDINQNVTTAPKSIESINETPNTTNSQLVVGNTSTVPQNISVSLNETNIKESLEAKVVESVGENSTTVVN